MTEIADPRTEKEVGDDIIDRSPGFADLLHRHNLIGDFESRTFTADQAMTLAREAYETGVLEYRHNPEEIDALEQELVNELVSRP